MEAVWRAQAENAAIDGTAVSEIRVVLRDPRVVGSEEATKGNSS